MNEVHLRAHAKLTLTLQVLETRPDGFHDLDAYVVSLSEPSDLLAVTKTAGDISLKVTGRGSENLPTDRQNLAYRAAETYLLETKTSFGAHIQLEKIIPMGAGLGGGSADAAAVLLAMNQMSDAMLSLDDLMNIAATVGSDVPVCLIGGFTHMSGRGEIIEPLPPVVGVPFLVIVPPFHSSTPEVFAAFDELPTSHAPSRSVLAPEEFYNVVTTFQNDLERAAEHVNPDLIDFRRGIETITESEPILAGSGSAYVLAGNFGPDIVSSLRDKLGALVWQTETVETGCSEVAG